MSKPVALGANIFAGGFSLGVSRHFRLLGHLEHDDGYGAEVSSKNLKVPVYVGKDQWPEKVGKLDFLYANPPCAIWSAAAGRPSHLWRQDPRLQRIRDIFSLIDQYHPPVWCWESVCQAFSRGREFVEELADEAKKRGYSATYLLIDAAYLGTPQHRKRFFLVLHNIEINWKTPDFTRVVTAGQALKGVKPDKNLLASISNTLERKWLEKTPPGGKLKNTYDRLVKKPKIGDRGQKLGRPSFLKRRLDPSRPSSTMIGNALFHNKETRFLAVNECAALCGFPQSWWWPKSDGYNLLARGVMPPVGEWLARHVAAALRKRKKIRPGRYLVDFRQSPGRLLDLQGGELPAGVDLDWRPEKVGEHQLTGKLGQGGGSRAGSRPRLQETGRPEAGQTRAERSVLSLGALAEATRRGIPDQKGREKIRVALRLLKAGQKPISSGMLIRARLLEGRMEESAIVIEVLKRYPNRKTTLADVGYHKYKMRRGGMLT